MKLSTVFQVFAEGSFTAAVSLGVEERSTEDQSQVNGEVGRQDGARHIANIELHLHVLHPRREAQDSVHRANKDTFVKELNSSLGLVTVDIGADNDHLGDHLGAENEDLPDQDVANKCDSDSQHDSSEQEEARLEKNHFPCLQIEALVELSVPSFVLSFRELVKVAK